LPVGALADRRRFLRIFNCWLAGSAGLLAVCSFLGGLTPEIILAGVFLLETGCHERIGVCPSAVRDIDLEAQKRSARHTAGNGGVTQIVQAGCLSFNLVLKPRTRPREDSALHPHPGLAARFSVIGNMVRNGLGLLRHLKMKILR
jgi:hypothetical protein